MELLRSDSRLGSLIILSGMVHTKGESLQDGLGDMWTCEMTLALAYMLHCLSVKNKSSGLNLFSFSFLFLFSF